MKELIRFQTDRNLHTNEFNSFNEIANIFEELLESIGLDVQKTDRPALKEELKTFITRLKESKVANDAVGVFGEYEQIDAFTDIIVFATGAILKLGHNPEIAITECGKEVNSRVGSMIDGKFEKDLSPEAQANWYKADYTKSKIK